MAVLGLIGIQTPRSGKCSLRRIVELAEGDVVVEIALGGSGYLTTDFGTNAAGNSQSPASATVSVTTAAIAAPTGLSGVFNSGTEITLNWTDHAADSDGDQVEWSIDNQDFQWLDDVEAGVGAYNVIDLVPGKSYYFRVETLADAGESAPSNWAATTPPLAPSGFSALAGFGIGAQVQLEWDQAEGSYDLERTTDDGDWQSLASPAAGQIS